MYTYIYIYIYIYISLSLTRTRSRVRFPGFEYLSEYREDELTHRHGPRVRRLARVSRAGPGRD